MNELLKILEYYPNETVLKKKVGGYSHYHKSNNTEHHLLSYSIYGERIRIYDKYYRTFLSENEIDFLAKLLSFEEDIVTFNIRLEMTKIVTNLLYEFEFLNIKITYKFASYQYDRKLLYIPKIQFSCKSFTMDFIEEHANKIIARMG